MKKKILTLTIIAAMLFSMTTTALAARFSDLDANHWAFHAVENMADKGIIKGTGGGKFSPDANVTGKEFITMLTRGFYGDQVLKEAQTNGGADWSVPYVQTATALKLLDGVTVSDNPVNRTDMAIIIYNFLIEKKAPLPTEEELAKITIPDFADSKLTADQQKKISNVYALGYLKGMDKYGNFKGHLNMDRAQAATVLSRLLETYQVDINVTADEIENARTTTAGK